MEAYTEWAMSYTKHKENFIDDSEFYINCIHVVIGMNISGTTLKPTMKFLIKILF